MKGSDSRWQDRSLLMGAGIFFAATLSLLRRIFFNICLMRCGWFNRIEQSSCFVICMSRKLLMFPFFVSSRTAFFICLMISCSSCVLVPARMELSVYKTYNSAFRKRHGSMALCGNPTLCGCFIRCWFACRLKHSHFVLCAIS